MLYSWETTPITINASEAASILKITVPRLTEWARNGDIEAAKIGKNWIFSRDYIRDVVEGRVTITPTPVARKEVNNDDEQ